jgi:hypothetical protein
MNTHAAQTSLEIVSHLSRRALRIHVIASLAAMSFASIGCLGAPEEAIGVTAEPAVTLNSLTTNSLTTNSLTTNSLTTNALTSNALTSNALTSNALIAAALEDPAARELLKYVVSCALPAGAQINVTVHDVNYTFPGELGLSPDWGASSGSCGPSCRAWVSACVLSRVNYLGVSVPLSIRGPHPALASTAQEWDSYPHGEATYWGDIFATPQIRRACLSPGQTEIPRVCGPSIQGCVMEVIGSCDQVCDGAREDGHFEGCGEEQGANADITVFLK